MEQTTLFGPFCQVATMDGIPLKGSIPDDKLPKIHRAGILIKDGLIEEIGVYDEMCERITANTKSIVLQEDFVCLPGFVDAHTHICFAGSRAEDYAKRNAGKTYLQIAEEGGGIWDTVTQTRNASKTALIKGILERANKHLSNGVTTIEIKSGYGLNVKEELKMLEAIKEANEQFPIDFISTCLAAHITPKDFKGSPVAYLKTMSEELLPLIRERNLSKRVDAFIEKGAFNETQIIPYLEKAIELGFLLTIHADQFSTGGSKIAVEFNALSADHLEVSTDREIDLLAQSNVVSIALPGASLGLGCGFTPARKILDAGGALAIASDHNPGSAPMGDLLSEAAILGSMEKLSNAEVLSAITFRAAAALNLGDRGVLKKGFLADLSFFPTSNLNEIFYHQGGLKPKFVVKNGKIIYEQN